MLQLFLIIWGADLFILSRRNGLPLRVPFFTFHKAACVLCALFLVLSLFKILPVEAAHLFLAGAVVFYTFFRRKAEKALYQNAYYERQQNIRPFLVFSFFGILLKWFCGILLLSIVIGLLAELIPGINSALGIPASLTLLAGLWMVFLIKSFCRRTGLYSLRDILGLTQPGPSFFWGWLVPVLCGAVLAFTSSALLVYRPHQPVTPFSEWTDWTSTPQGFGVFLLAAVIVGPFLEEIMFRGFFFRMIRDFKNTRWAFWIVTLSFGFLHIEQYRGDWASILLIFLVGAVLSMLRCVTGSVRPSIVLHYVFNILMVIVPGIMFLVSHPSFAQYYRDKHILPLKEQQVILEKSIEEDSRNVLAYYELAWLYLDNEGDLQEALEIIEKALALSPRRSILQHTKGEILDGMGRHEEALRIFEKIVNNDPDNLEIKARISEIRENF